MEGIDCFVSTVVDNTVNTGPLATRDRTDSETEQSRKARSHWSPEQRRRIQSFICSSGIFLVCGSKPTVFDACVSIHVFPPVDCEERSKCAYRYFRVKVKDLSIAKAYCWISTAFVCN